VAKSIIFHICSSTDVESVELYLKSYMISLCIMEKKFLSYMHNMDFTELIHPEIKLIY